MKKTAILLMLVALMVTFFGCTKDSDDSTTTPSLSLKFQGNAWTATTVAATYISYNNTTTITASKIGTSDQFVTFYTGTGEGTYTAEDEKGYCSGTIGSVTFSTVISDFPTGAIIVTHYDASKKLISGTFSFTGNYFSGGDWAVTEGKFENVPVVLK